MSNAPQISFMPRVWSDIAECMDFLARQPWGMPLRREFEIHAAFERIRAEPFAHPVSGYVPGSGIGSRIRQNTVPAQAAIASASSDTHLRRTSHGMATLEACSAAGADDGDAALTIVILPKARHDSAANRRERNGRWRGQPATS
jgi:hypothetical protein